MTGTLRDYLLKKSSKTQGKVLSKVFESLTCSICHEYMYVPMMTQCGHNYCYDCLLAWFESNPEEELSCPQCRASVINTPSLNSALQQWLCTVFEAVNDEENDDDDDDNEEKEALVKLTEARRICENSYKQDEKNDDLFKGIFQNSAVGVVDKEDDGILRCSNCHWELEDDEDDVCPHCHLRIRSRPVISRENSDSVVDYSADDDARENIRDPPLVAYAEYATEYFVGVQNFVQLLRDTDNIPTDEPYQDSPFYFCKLELSSGSKILYPSFSAYLFYSLTSCYMDRQIFIQIVHELEAHALDGDNLNRFIEEQYELYEAETHNPMDEDVFDSRIRNLQKSVRAYKAKVLEYVEDTSNSQDRLLKELRLRFPLLLRRSMAGRFDLVLPSYSVYAQCDYTLNDQERGFIVPMIKHIEYRASGEGEVIGILEPHSARRSRADDEAEDSSMDDFIASEDDEIDQNNLVDLEASERSSDATSDRSHDEELDSDYFERNEGDGFVSGDSLDDGDGEHRDANEGQEGQDDEDDDEDSAVVPVVHKARKRNHAVVEESEDESM